VDRMLALLETDGYTPVSDVRLYTAEEDRQWRESRFPEPYVCLAPTAKWLCKCWPVENYVEVAKRLRGLGKRVVVLAGPSERARLKPLLDLDVSCPETTVGRLMALIERAELLVCNDSAPLHMAVGFDRPIVTIFGPTDPALVGPYQRQDTVIQPADIQRRDVARYRKLQSDQTLIRGVDVETVWQRIEQRLNAS